MPAFVSHNSPKFLGLKSKPYRTISGASKVEPVDVVLLTMNSDRKLEACLESVYQNVSISNLIAIDGGSTDKTVQVLKEFHNRFGNVKIVSDKNGTRATARQKGIENVTTNWFMFVDSDVILCRDWHKKAARQMADDVGAVWGTEVWSTLRHKRTLKLFLMVTRKIFELRGGTHDTLIRSAAVNGIRIPRSLHVFEDGYIKDWIVKQGYRVVACYDPFCVHYRPSSVWTFRGSLGILSESLRVVSPKLIARLLFAYGFYTAYSVAQMLSGRIGQRKARLS